MDEKPKCSHTVGKAPIKQQPPKHEQPESKKDPLILPEELTPATETQTLLIQPEELTPAAKTQTLLILPEELTAAAKIENVLLKELPASPELETSPKTQSTLINQPIYLMEQAKLSKDQPGFSGDQPAFSKNQLTFSEDQPSHSKDQPNYSKDQPSFSKTQTALTASLTKIYIDSTKDGSTSSREFLVAPNIQIDKSEGESCLTKEETKLIMTKYTATSKACNINKDYFLSSNAPLKITSSTQSPNTNKHMSPATAMLTLPPLISTPGQPLSLFLQALTKLNESSLALTVLPFRLQSSPNLSKICNVVSGDITPPDSLTSAPPTYSFVLRQMAVRRRPRFMGTFFPSPSFVQHAPPPTYTGAFDVYIEPALPPPPARVYSFGFSSMPVVCQECGFTGMTLTKSRVTICTHLCAVTLCLLCCWICAPLPYFLSSCKDVYHYCRNCRTFLGMYCPTNPEAAYPNA